MSIDVHTPAYRVLADDLRSQITSGQLQPGDRLPTEPQLCRDSGVSRSTVREALRLLTSQHLIVTTRGVAGGSFVAHPSAEQLSETITIGVRLMQASAVVDAAHLLEVREMVEIGAAGYAAQRRVPADLAKLRAALFDPRSTDVEAMCALHPAFHRAILAACANPVLELVAAPLHGVVNIRALVDSLDIDFWIKVDADHRAILAAIESGDRDGAAAAAATHLAHLRETLTSSHVSHDSQDSDELPA